MMKSEKLVKITREITKTQAELLILLKNGNSLFAYQDFKRFVMSPHTKNANVINPKIVNPLLHLDIFIAKKVKHGYRLDLRESTETKIKPHAKSTVIVELEKLEVNRYNVHGTAQAAIDGFMSETRKNPYGHIGSVRWVAWQVGKGQKEYNERFSKK